MALFSNHGILGINARNLLYIRPFNRRKAVKMADSKLKTKNFLSARGIPVPRLYGTIRSLEELEKFDFSSLPNNFVLKPNRGAGGEGILPIWDRREGQYVLSDGRLMSQRELEEHIRDVLDGRFSISGIADTAFFEQLLVCDERLAKFAYKGLPDLRIVVHNLVPVMAMLRLPTKRSHGKGNLHQGAIGVGIDIAKGECTHAVEGVQIIDEIPGVGPIRGFKIPYWDDILMVASKIQVETNLGYLAVDISIDQNTGPVLLEINARAGLGLQIANLSPLRRRLEQIQGVKVPNPEKGVRVAKDMFGHVVEREIKSMTGKEVIGTLEPAKLLVGSQPFRVLARVNASIEKSQIDQQFAEDVGFVKAQTEGADHKAKFILAGKRVQTIMSLTDLSTKDYKMVIGRRDLAGFLLDPSKKPEDEISGIEALPTEVEKVSPNTLAVTKPAQKNYRLVDEAIVEIDQQIKLLYHLKPLNLESEREAFLAGDIENPQFIYPELKFDPYKLRERLDKLEMDDSILGRLFQRKRQEILQKIDLLEHRGTSHFYGRSSLLFGEVTQDLLALAQTRLSERPSSFPQEKGVINADQAQRVFEKFFKAAGLLNWRVKQKKEMVSDCVAGKKNTFFIREDVQFTPTRLAMVIAHEIETHIFTAENGKLQPYLLFQRGTGGYLTTQEGLAIYMQEKAVEHETPKHFWNAALVVLIHKAQTGSFRDVYELACEMGYKEKAFQFALKSKRGLEDTSQLGAFTKDLIYFRGRQMIKDFVADGGDLSRLYIGKIDLPSLVEIEQLPFLVSPTCLPSSFKE